LLHVVRDDNDSVAGLELVDQLLDALRRDRVERRGGLVHQQDLGLHRERARDAQPLLLSPRERQRGGVQPILDLVPQRRRLEARLDASAQLFARTGEPVDPQAVGDVVENRFRKRVRALEDHPDAAAQIDHVHRRGVDVLAVDGDGTLDARAGHDVVHPVQRAQERRFATARRPDQRGDLVGADLDGDLLEHAAIAVEEVQLADVNLGGSVAGRLARRGVSGKHLDPGERGRGHVRFHDSEGGVS